MKFDYGIGLGSVLKWYRRLGMAIALIDPDA